MFEKWINEAAEFQENVGGMLIATAGRKDYFVDPGSDVEVFSAPFYAKEINGDFTLTCRVKPEFMADYDAGGILIFANNYYWAKFAFEKTDMGHTAVVSVVTKGESDDANGERVTSDAVWLRMTRCGEVVIMYCSDNGVEWRMVRQFGFKAETRDIVYVGLEAQSPIGDGCRVEFSDITFVTRSVHNLRKGV